MQPRQFNQQLYIPLTEAEKLADLTQLTEFDRKKSQVEIEKKSAMDAFKAQLSKLDEQMREIFVNVRSNKKLADVECLEYLDEETKQVITVRNDTGEIINVRECKPAEYQRDLILEEEELEESPIERVRERGTIDKLTEFCFEYSREVGREVSNDEVLSWSDSEYKAVQQWLMLVIYSAKHPTEKVVIGEMPDVLKASIVILDDTSAEIFDDTAKTSEAGSETAIETVTDYEPTAYVKATRLEQDGDIFESYSGDLIKKGKIRKYFEFGENKFVTVCKEIYPDSPAVCFACKLIESANFNEEDFPVSERIDYVTGIDTTQYHGVKVAYKAKEYILVEPQVRFMAQLEEIPDSIKAFEDTQYFQVDSEKFKEIDKTRSAQTIAEKKSLAGIFEFEGQNWTVTGGVSGQGIEEVIAYRVLTAKEFQNLFPEDEILTYREQTSLPGDYQRRWTYHGMRVAYKKTDYVLAYPKAYFTKKEETQIDLSENERLFVCNNFTAVVNSADVPEKFDRYSAILDKPLGSPSEIEFYVNTEKPVEYVNVEKHYVCDLTATITPAEGYKIFEALTRDEKDAVKVAISAEEVPENYDGFYWDSEFSQLVFWEYSEISSPKTAKILRIIWRIIQDESEN